MLIVKSTENGKDSNLAYPKSRYTKAETNKANMNGCEMCSLQKELRQNRSRKRKARCQTKILKESEISKFDLLVINVYSSAHHAFIASHRIRICSSNECSRQIRFCSSFSTRSIVDLHYFSFFSIHFQPSFQVSQCFSRFFRQKAGALLVHKQLYISFSLVPHFVSCVNLNISTRSTHSDRFLLHSII